MRKNPEKMFANVLILGKRVLEIIFLSGMTCVISLSESIYSFALHSLSENELKKDFNSRTAAINAHISARQKSMQMWMKGKFPESDFASDPKYNIDTLKDLLAVRRLETLENNTKVSISCPFF